MFNLQSVKKYLANLFTKQQGDEEVEKLPVDLGLEGLRQLAVYAAHELEDSNDRAYFKNEMVKLLENCDLAGEEASWEAIKAGFAHHDAISK